MNKFKFGDHVHVAFPHWHDADEIGVVLGSSRGVNNVQFENGGYTGYVPDEYLTLATSWVKCSERMPETYTKVLVLVEVGNDSKQHIFVDELYESTKYGMTWQNNDNLVTHWMPLPTPPMEIANE